MEWVGPFLGTLAGVWAVIWLHEFGHYLTGRRIVNIDAENIRLVDPYFPRYVALRDSATEEWVEPTSFQRYRTVYEQYDPNGEHAERFAAGGELIQALVVVPLALLAGLFVSQMTGVALVAISLLVTIVYATLDAAATLSRDELSGDYSLLWHSAPRLPILILVGFVSLHLAVLFFLL